MSAGNIYREGRHVVAPRQCTLPGCVRCDGAATRQRRQHFRQGLRTTDVRYGLCDVCRKFIADMRGQSNALMPLAARDGQPARPPHDPLPS